MLAWWFGPRRKAARLDRDAAAIVELAQSVSPISKARDAALQIRDALEVAHDRGGDDPSRYGPLIQHFRSQHRVARSRRDDTALTALTLVIIYLSAETLGEAGKPARDRIDAFVSAWTRV